jgi:hypothetical protein
MKTNELIAALAADTRTHSTPVSSAWAIAGAGAILAAAAVFFMTIGPRSDITAATTTARFLFKFVVTLALAASAFFVLQRLARPGASTRTQWLALLAAPVLLALAVGVELAVQPQGQWSMLSTGKNSLNCLTYIPLIGIGPLAAFILALRRGAPTRPALAGAVAGIVAGGIAATFYAANCTDDSPLFVATWYPIAIAILAVLGAAAGRVFARW